MATKLSSYYTYLNTNLLENLPKDLGLVLDIGCASGELGNAYKKDNKKSVWHGIDIHKDAIKSAKKNLDAAWELDADVFKTNSTMTKKKYDAIIYSLSLEQLKDPADALKKHIKLLKKGGKIYFCFPNTQHWSLLRHLISGNWDYSEKGILHHDNQHQFTRKSFIKLIDSVDLKLSTMSRYSYENTKLFKSRRGARLQTIQKMKEFCESTQLYFNENDLRTYHYVMAVEKK